MGERRGLLAMIAVGAIFLIAVSAVFLSNLTPDGAYEILTERRGDAGPASPSPGEGYAPETPEPRERVNINTASLEELCTIPGIGETRAQAILDHREANGPFLSPADIMLVSGIGEGIYSNISDYITVGEASQ